MLQALHNALPKWRCNGRSMRPRCITDVEIDQGKVEPNNTGAAAHTKETVLVAETR